MIYYVCGLINGFLITMAVAVILWHTANKRTYCVSKPRIFVLEDTVKKLLIGFVEHIKEKKA